MDFKWKWSLDDKNKYSITTKVNGDYYEFNCNLPIRNILTSEAVSVFLYDEKTSDEIIENNPKEYYGNLFKNDELFESDISLNEAGRIIDKDIEKTMKNF